jgi:hypothetical protein
LNKYGKYETKISIKSRFNTKILEKFNLKHPIYNIYNKNQPKTHRKTHPNSKQTQFKTQTKSEISQISISPTRYLSQTPKQPTTIGDDAPVNIKSRSANSRLFR